MVAAELRAMREFGSRPTLASYAIDALGVAVVRTVPASRADHLGGADDTRLRVRSDLHQRELADGHR